MPRLERLPPPLTDEQRALVEAHLEFARSGARKYAARWRPRFTEDELFSAACFGLCLAAARFDPARGFTFKTYAMHWTEQQIRRVAQKDKREMGGWRWSSGGRRGYMEPVLQRADWPVHDDGAPVEFPAPDEPVELVDQIAQDQQIAQVLALVPQPRDREILARRLQGQTHRQIAPVVGLTVGGVWMRERALLKRVRRALCRRVAS